MCSIAGIYRTSGSVCEEDLTLLASMNRSMRHRGPDANGTYPSAFCESGIHTRCALAHNRLAVIDLTGGKQPMQITYGGRHYAITYNGELYNTEEVRTELLRAGICFQTRSDTEVIAYAYAYWGEECPAHLNGIFAFGIYCEEDESLFLARDRFGVKPLFFTESAGCFYFASELKALFCVRKPYLDRVGLWQLFFLSPASLSGSGIFKDIYELKGAESATVTPHGLSRRTYWQLEAHPCSIMRDEPFNIRASFFAMPWSVSSCPTYRLHACSRAVLIPLLSVPLPRVLTAARDAPYLHIPSLTRTWTAFEPTSFSRTVMMNMPCGSHVNSAVLIPF